MTAQGLVGCARVDREHLRQQIGGRSIGQQSGELGAQPVQLRGRADVRWPVHARRERLAAGAAEAGQPDRHLAEQRRDPVPAIVLHPVRGAAVPALRTVRGMNPGLRGDDLLLNTGQELLALGQGQAEAGQVGEVVGPGDPQDIGAALFSVGSEAHQSHDPGHVASTSTGKTGPRIPPSALAPPISRQSPVPLPARGGAADLRGRPPRQEGAEEAGPGRAPGRALGRGARRPRGRGGARLLRGGAQRDHRRWPAALGRLGPQARGPARGGRRQPRPGGGKRGMTRLLRRLRRLVADALDRTRDLWPDIRRAYAWVHGAARILNNAAGLDAAAVARRLAGLVAAVGRHRAKAGALAGAVDHFLKVTRSYRPGLFHCYAVADLPRTNNDLEQLFGSSRRHERRATGRKANSSATVLRGPVRLLAGLATRLRRRDAGDLAGADRPRWREVRASLERRRHARVLRARFRRDPAAYLSRLEQLLRQPALLF